MTIRGDISIDWSASPRIITVAAPSDTVSLQDLYDTLRSISDDPEAMDEAEIVEGSGKDQIGIGRYTGLTIRLYNAKVAFEARVAWTYCTITGGNMVAVDEGGDPMLPLHPTAYVNIGYEADVSAALLEGSGGATPGEIADAVRTELASELSEISRVKVLIANRLRINKTTGIWTVYATDKVTPLYTGTLEDNGTFLDRVPA